MSNRVHDQFPGGEFSGPEFTMERLWQAVEAAKGLAAALLANAPINGDPGPYRVRIVLPHWPWRADSVQDRPSTFYEVGALPEEGGYQRHVAEAIASTQNGIYIGDKSDPTLLWAIVESDEPEPIRGHSTVPSEN